MDFNTLSFQLRMKLICESIKSTGDFDNDQINAAVRQKLYYQGKPKKILSGIIIPAYLRRSSEYIYLPDLNL